VLRFLRVAALICNVFVGIIGMILLGSASEESAINNIPLVLGLVLVSIASVLSIASRFAERPVYWVAMALNAMLAVAAGFAFLRGHNGILLLLVPALLNMVTIEALRVVRARLG
jgi:hypothetical protein